jgi:hypothetical protein
VSYALLVAPLPAWLRLGPIRVHVAACLLPAFLVLIERVRPSQGLLTAASAATAVSAVLFLQPDAAQAAADRPQRSANLAVDEALTVASSCENARSCNLQRTG